MIVLNNLFLLTACATVMLGTLYPMLMEWLSDDRITVGPPYFNVTFLPLVALPLILAGLTPFMPWQKAHMKRVRSQVMPSLWASVAAGVLIYSAVRANAVLAALGLTLAWWLAGCSLQWVRKQGFRSASLAVFLGHFGAAVLVAGVTGASLWKEEAERAIHVGDTVDIAGYKAAYEKQSFEDTPNYHAKHGRFRITDSTGQQVAILKPEYRTYDIRKSATSKAAIHATPWYDIYAVIGESSPDGEHTAVRLYYNPLISLIWTGFILMAAGGITGILRRRYEY
jgi:cytochrome c-type biogenesis protein CcmF